MCMCEACQENYDECSNFTRYDLVCESVNSVSLRSALQTPTNEIEHEGDEVNDNDDFLLPNTICAVAAANSSRDTIWFVRIANNNKLAQENVSDDYGNVIGVGQSFIEGSYLEEVDSTKNGIIYKLSKIVFFLQGICGLSFCTAYKKKRKGTS